MACEIVSELAFSRHFDNRGIKDLRDPIDELLPNFNLGNPKVRKLYEALSGDKITQVGFWKDYTDVVKLRNTIVHKGGKTTAGPARDAVKTASDLVAHIETVLKAQDAKKQSGT